MHGWYHQHIRLMKYKQFQFNATLYPKNACRLILTTQRKFEINEVSAQIFVENAQYYLKLIKDVELIRVGKI